MNKKAEIRKYVIIFIIFIFFLLSCSGKKAVDKRSTKTNSVETEESQTPPPLTEEQYYKPQEREPLKVIVSTDLIREIMYAFANSRTKGRALIANGTNPLSYVPTEQDKKEMLEAKLVFYMGRGLEPALETYLLSIKNKVRVVALLDAFDKSELIPSQAYKGGYDPHFWWDPELWEKAILYLLKILDDYDPEYQYSYQSTFIRYGESLSHLNRYFTTWLGRLPAGTILLTLNPAYTYLGKACNLKTMSVLAPGTLQLNSKRLNEVTEYIIDHKITTIFPESDFPRNEIDQVITAAKAKGYTLKIGEELFSYSLGPGGKPEFSYLPAGRELVDRIYTALKAEGELDVPSRMK